MNDIMINLETLDTKATAVIISISAVAFNSQKITEKFYAVVNRQSCIDLGLTVSAEMISWWMGQPNKAREVFIVPGMPLENVLHRFTEWLPNNPMIWGDGASFDNVIMTNAYSACKIKQPWSFRNDRCYRTAVAGYTKRMQQGTRHNALDDAISQAEHLICLGYDAK